MKLQLKNMVCQRCCMVVKSILQQLDLSADQVSLGEIDFGDRYGEKLEPVVYQELLTKLDAAGFELLNTKQQQLIEKIKLLCLQMIVEADGQKKEKLSTVLSSSLKRDYNYLSSLFSSVEGATIEQFYIQQRIEKVKELLVYGELSLGEIAYQLGFSSAAHLSNQFKKITGLTPGYFRKSGR